MTPRQPGSNAFPPRHERTPEAPQFQSFGPEVSEPHERRNLFVRAGLQHERDGRDNLTTDAVKGATAKMGQRHDLGTREYP